MNQMMKMFHFKINNLNMIQKMFKNLYYLCLNYIQDIINKHIKIRNVIIFIYGNIHLFKIYLSRIGEINNNN